MAADAPVSRLIADRAYDDAGNLVSRSLPGAVLHDAEACARRVLDFLDDGAIRSVSGRVLVDGAVRSGMGAGPLTNFAGSSGELSGSFADVRANSVSGDVTVLRRAEGATTDASASGSAEAAGVDEEEW